VWVARLQSVDVGQPPCRTPDVLLCFHEGAWPFIERSIGVELLFESPMC
jgi:hypothetical protein